MSYNVSESPNTSESKRVANVKNATCQFVPMRYVVAGLVLLATLVLYICRLNLSVAIVAMSRFNSSGAGTANGSDVCWAADTDQTINATVRSDQNMGEFDWDEKGQGVILGAFFWGYVAFMVPGGRLSEVFGAKWMCGGGVAVSILVNVLTPVIARSGLYYLLLASRVVLGVFQSLVFPSAFALFTKWAPDHERSLFLSIPFIGANIGSIVNSALAGYLSKHGFAGGWPSVFYVSGIIAFVWLLLWIVLVRSEPKAHPWISKAELSYIECNISANKSSGQTKKTFPWLSVFSSMPVIAATVVKFTINWNNILFFLKLPSYLQKVLKYPVDQIGIIGSIIYAILSISLFMSGFIADYLVQKQILDKTLIRKIFETFATIGSSICLAAIPLADCNKTLVIALLMIGMFLFGMQAGGDIAVVADMTNKYAATVFALANTVAMTCGFITPLVIGWIVKASDQPRRQWGYVFYLSAALNVFGAVFFIIFGSAKQQPFDKDSDESPVITRL